MSGRHGCGFFGVTNREFSLFLFGEGGDFFEETLTLTSGLCYQWLHVVLLAFVQENQKMVQFLGCV